MFCEIFSPCWHVLETLQGKYENNFPLFILLSIFLYIILRNNDSSLNSQGFLHGVQKRFSTKFLLVYVLEEKYQRCFWKTWKNYTTEVSTVGQILLQYSRNNTFVFTRNVNKHWMDQEVLYQIVIFISQFSLVFSYKILKMFLQ